MGNTITEEDYRDFIHLKPLDFSDFSQERILDYLIITNALIRKLTEYVINGGCDDLDTLTLLELAIKRLTGNYDNYNESGDLIQDLIMWKLSIDSKRLLADANIAVIEILKKG